MTRSTKGDVNFATSYFLCAALNMLNLPPSFSTEKTSKQQIALDIPFKAKPKYTHPMVTNAPSCLLFAEGCLSGCTSYGAGTN